MARQTSIDSYKEIVADGTLSKRQLQVYKALYVGGPMTQRETEIAIFGKLGHSITPRFAELERSGAIRTPRKRVCKITKRTVHEWEITGSKPLKFDRPKKIKCKHCKGKGYFTEQQAKLF